MRRLGLAFVFALAIFATNADAQVTWHCYYIGQDQWCNDNQGDTCHTYWIGDHSYTQCTGPNFR